jgi:predicted nuclease with TOPRIM domain
MDVLSLISDWSGLVGSIISAVVGGGLVSAYNAYRKGNRKAEEAQHTQAMELSERLEDRLSSVEGRLDAAEEELRKTQKRLTQSQIRREELSAAIDALVQRIDRLISRLASHEQITEREREELTRVPYVDSDTYTPPGSDSAPK